MINETLAQELRAFVYAEARMLGEKRFDEWYELFTEDAMYWVPLTPGQPDGLNHVSLMYEDKLLLKLRIERLKNVRSYSQQPASRSHHLLQAPDVEQADEAAGIYVTRTQFIYTETQGNVQQMYAGTVFHTLARIDRQLKIALKRVDLLNCDACLPAIQLFM
ncbi:phenylpropionate dioxygenase [Massilia eurypsychrophila]|jgi:3-phenylpropionate/cinnamic acid dioxygenase small subunit|uniref:Phenylpropionate dioxygenase n=1 Tax=Massilia eurypsychrophila TaxID=1485217 RepID=A0A2G8TJH4_9BURK|nr:aromatic-ring-hydroxylating dioxygenase subunit beta [Massilia eurypsychrophila]PIL45758.1 phenylpropionate dioxygenase [Massilia eurypsychrophila]